MTKFKHRTKRSLIRIIVWRERYIKWLENVHGWTKLWRAEARADELQTRVSQLEDEVIYWQAKFHTLEELRTNGL